MGKKTTVILDDEIYIELVNISIKKYGSSRHISRVINELLKRALKGSLEDFLNELKELISGPKLAKVSPKEFEEFRKELSKRFES